MVSMRAKTYASVAQSTRTWQKSPLQEVAKVRVSFNERNEPDVVTAEGMLEPQAGSLPAVTQHALRVADSSRIRELGWEEIPSQVDGDDEENSRKIPPTDSGDESDISCDSRATSVSSESFSLSSRSSIDLRSTEGRFIMPKNTVKRMFKWSAPDRLTNKFKIFPSWFELSQDEDQLGPIPRDWLEDRDVPVANSRSLEYADTQGINSADAQVESMAIIVEVLDDSRAEESKQLNKGKGVGAGERSAGFAAYLHKMQQDKAAQSFSNDKPEKKAKAQ